MNRASSTFPIINPSTGKIITQVLNQKENEIDMIIQRAIQTFNVWSRTTIKEREIILKRWHALMMENVDHLAQIIHLEQGKPLNEAKEEVYDGALFLEWYAEEAKRIHGVTPLSPDSTRRLMTIKQPIGVVGVITPWNFPLAIPLQKCIPAIAVGCTVILKPAEETPLSALEQSKLAHQAGLPEGIFNVVTCQNPIKIGHLLANNPSIRKLTFTGSTQVGRFLMKESGQTIKKICLELGGNSPVIIFEDADLEWAVEKTAQLKFYNAGQVCNSVNRFFVHQSIYEIFIEAFYKKIEHLTLGPLINMKMINKINKLLIDAERKGAQIIGGKHKELFFEPTIVKEARPNMHLFHEEIFGPIAPIYRFSSEEEVITLANQTEYGLAAYLFTQNMTRCFRVAERLEAGSVGINTTDIYSELLPFGGWKQSGLSREMGLEKSLDDFLETKSLVIGNLKML